MSDSSVSPQENADSPEISASAPDGRILADFFRELNIFLKNLSTYPAQHPLIKSSEERVISVFERALGSRSEIKITVSPDSLFLEESCIDSENPLLHKFADRLFHRGVAAITFGKGLDGKDLVSLNRILNLNPELVWEMGGVDKVLAEMEALHLHAEKIDYGLFSSTEESEAEALDGTAAARISEDLWKNFVGAVLKGISRGAKGKASTGAGTPDELATAVDNYCTDITSDLGGFYGDAVDFFVMDAAQGNRERDDTRFLRKFFSFLRALSPETRKQFMANICNSAIECSDLALKLVQNSPKEIIHDVLSEVHSGKIVAPPTIMNLLQKLGGMLPAADRDTPETTDPGEKELEAFTIIFRENDYSNFVPSRYRQKLQALVNHDPISDDTLKNITEMKETLSAQQIDNSVSLLIIELLQSSDGMNAELLTDNLLELCAYFLQIGDFTSLSDTCRRLRGNNAWSRTGAESAGRKIEAFFTDARFLEEVLDGLSIWGKPKFKEIGTLIETVGSSFIQPLLNRLAEEQNISARRFYMDRLMKMGEAARDAVVARLDDSRWYFLRNLLILLCSMNDPSVLPQIRKLQKHPHPKVRLEVIRCLLHFNDPEAEELLLREMESKDQEVRLSTIKLAEKSRKGETHSRLRAFVENRGLGDLQLEVKIAAIKTLAEIGDVEAIPILVRLLRSRNFFHRKKHAHLKEEILRSLARYNHSSGKETLLEMARSSSRKVAKVAAAILERPGE